MYNMFTYICYVLLYIGKYHFLVYALVEEPSITQGTQMYVCKGTSKINDVVFKQIFCKWVGGYENYPGAVDSFR